MTTLSTAETASYEALATSAVWWKSNDEVIAFRGEKAAEALNGLVTNDVTVMLPGDCLYAAALSPKGKLVTDMLIVRINDANLLTLVPPGAAQAWRDLTRKYVNPRLCKVTDESGLHAVRLVYGAEASSAIDAFRPTATVARAPSLGSIPGWVLVEPAANGANSAWELSEGTQPLWDVVRVEAGWPAIGVDMDENTIPQEANLDKLGAISFSKGCYTGQETVARVHFRGHVNRFLRGVVGTTPLTRGAQLSDAGGKVVGDVRSTVVSPRYGPIALAMIRREVTSGDSLHVDGGGDVRVTDLPFSNGIA
jgi:folate-binding protein YgfZ